MPDTTLSPNTPLGRYYAATKPREGARSTQALGRLDATTIRRYALTIGTDDPIHFDTETAQTRGYADIVAPPNLLAAIFEWGAGTAEADLSVDGTPPDPGSADLTLRAMGAGEEMELVRPAVAGTEIICDETLEEVAAKETRGGPCVFVSTTHVFRTSDGTVLNRNRRTIVRRNPSEE